MTGIRVTSTTGDLESDLRKIAERAPRDMAAVVRHNLREGNQIAKNFARESAGAHGKHYPNAFGYEMTGVHQGEYGPDAEKPQGGMSFERGSRNQKPHLDLARSADVIGPAFADDVHDLPDRWFWPES